MATLYILYGSATGNAEYIAKDLASKSPPPPFTSIVCDVLEKFKKYSDAWSQPPSTNTSGGVSKHGLIVICSTTGNGDPPENASRFARYIKRKTTLDARAFEHVAFAVLGLGDTNYDVFCGAAKSLDKKLEEAGGTRIQALACADEATGLEDVVEPWTASILPIVATACSSSSNSSSSLCNGDKNAETIAEKNISVPKEESKNDNEEKVPESTPQTSKPQQPPNSAILQTLDKNRRSSSPLFILYGSATGNAEQIAKDLAATYNSILSNPDSVTYFPSVVCCDLNGWRKQCLPLWETPPPAAGSKHGVIIITSTTGNADPPENADRFVRWLKRKQTAQAMPFAHVAYSVLGLGDTNYDVFCAMGKLVDKKLQELGGCRVKALACADEATGLEDVVDPWVAKIIFEMSIACQGTTTTTTDSLSSNDAVAVEKQRDTLSSEEEEKKMDTGDVVSPSIAYQAPPVAAPDSAKTFIPVASSSGVRAICSILNLDCNSPLQEVDRKCLPHIGTSLSSCQLLTKLEHEEQDQLTSADDDRVTVSSASSSSIHYTLKRPFESAILNARYLTVTPTKAAQMAADILSGYAPENGSEDNVNAFSALIQQATDVYTDHFPLVVADTTSKEKIEKNGKRVIELTLALPDDFTLEYNPGDSLGLIVENTPDAVEFVLGMLREHQGIVPEQHVSIDNGNPITVRDAISREIDLCSPLKSKRIISSISQHATDPQERKALQLLASKTPLGEKAFEEFVEKQRLSVVDLLKEFPSCLSIPLAALLSILPGIPPRYYSVSSSPLACQQDLSLTVSFSVVDYVTPSLKTADREERGLRRKKGVATSYLEVLASPFLAATNGSTTRNNRSITVKVFPKPTAEFRMPSNLATPMVLVGPGTGIGKSLTRL